MQRASAGSGRARIDSCGHHHSQNCGKHRYYCPMVSSAAYQWISCCRRRFAVNSNPRVSLISMPTLSPDPMFKSGTPTVPESKAHNIRIPQIRREQE
jgi:hypothetical protein